MARRDALASVAAQLLAFYREPALVRPAFLHGDMPLPDGRAVLRLALNRIPADALSRFSDAERAELRLAAAAFVRQVCLWERATHYQVLCLPPDARAEAVKETYHLLIALIHPDRRDGAGDWPRDCAQRANQAYEVLRDAVRRAHYDRELRQAHVGATREAGGRKLHVPEAGLPRPSSRRHGVNTAMKRAAVVAAVVALLFGLQAWWVGDDSPDHSLLQSAASGRWMREMLPDPPRFLAATAAFDPGERLEPIRPPQRLAALSSWGPVAEALAGPVAAAAPGAATAATPMASASPTPSLVSMPPDAGALRLAQSMSPPPRAAPQSSSSPSARPSPLQAAPATTPVPGPAGTPTREQVEGVVALLVSFYDAGDAKRLVNLFDPVRLSLWNSHLTRTAYGDFFDTTRERKLRLERLAWESRGASAIARGEATVIADYLDGRPRLERRVPVELEIGLRDGQPRIERLVLFPLPE